LVPADVSERFGLFDSSFGGGGRMLTWARWVSLVLAVSTLVAWAAVSGLRLACQGPSFAETMTHGAPQRITDPMMYIIEPPVSHAVPRGADVPLHITAALLVSVHLVLLNVRRDRP
jgi:hypothetical protein